MLRPVSDLPDVEEFTTSHAAIDHLIERLPSMRADHLEPLLQGLKFGMKLVICRRGGGPFDLPPSDGALALLIASASCGPDQFDEASIGRALRAAAGVCVTSTTATEAALSVAGLALVSGQRSILIETTARFEADWLAAIKRLAPDARVLLSTSVEGRA
ncbi:MAG TPA: hypothetical protein VGV37_29635 [Aliidongia sp.]|uniref:hypothetical protein n=1 Tax=Aliidongia sp. TaxID=1914230 RepID=UPI002DDD2348|nr:hypothetical protein [Aliidongia sp.]HEV2678726.1 hypothetical protein [Aliidongia sp.]